MAHDAQYRYELIKMRYVFAVDSLFWRPFSRDDYCCERVRVEMTGQTGLGKFRIQILPRLRDKE
jgi:hypothetical protein